MARRHGIEVVDSSAVDDVTTAIRDLTDGRGTDSAIDAVGHGGARRLGDPAARAEDGQQAPGRHLRAADAGRRASTAPRRWSGASTRCAAPASCRCPGVYGGTADPINMLKIFDKGISLQMGQAHVKRWIPEILPLLTDEDPLGVHDLETHRLPLESAAHGYEISRRSRTSASRSSSRRERRPPEPSLYFIGTATTLLRCAGFTILTDPNFLHRGQRAYLGKGLTSTRADRAAPAPRPSCPSSTASCSRTCTATTGTAWPGGRSTGRCRWSRRRRRPGRCSRASASGGPSGCGRGSRTRCVRPDGATLRGDGAARPARARPAAAGAAAGDGQPAGVPVAVRARPCAASTSRATRCPSTASGRSASTSARSTAPSCTSAGRRCPAASS